MFPCFIVVWFGAEPIRHKEVANTQEAGPGRATTSWRSHSQRNILDKVNDPDLGVEVGGKDPRKTANTVTLSLLLYLFLSFSRQDG